MGHLIRAIWRCDFSICRRRCHAGPPYAPRQLFPPINACTIAFGSVAPNVDFVGNAEFDSLQTRRFARGAVGFIPAFHQQRAEFSLDQSHIRIAAFVAPLFDQFGIGRRIACGLMIAQHVGVIGDG